MLIVKLRVILQFLVQGGVFDKIRQNICSVLQASFGKLILVGI
jgi:hypothetical protein